MCTPLGNAGYYMGFNDLTNKKFHRLTVLKLIEKNGLNSKWLCTCECGKEKIILGRSLTSGNTKSCGCLNSEVHRDIAKLAFKKEWKPIDRGDYYDIPLTKNKFSKIDKSDYEIICNFGWYYAARSGYAYSGSINNCSKENTRKVMHRYIMNVSSSNIQIDHINGDRLDNRRSNLRLATNAENSRNGYIRKDNKSGHRGISFDSSRNKWFAEICKDKKRYRKRFKYKEDAIAWYKEKAIALFGEFCALDKYEHKE